MNKKKGSTFQTLGALIQHRFIGLDVEDVIILAMNTFNESLKDHIG